MKVFNGLDELRAAKGQQIGASEWLTIGQDQIDGFADATLDRQWIHVDPERAAAGPFGSTIAHGFLTLSLLVAMVSGTYRVEDVRMTVNYGLNKVRFTAPVPVGSRVRGVVELLDVSDVAGGAQVTTKVTVELDGSQRPALVAEWVTRLYV